MKPEQLEIARLKREVVKLKAERDIPLPRRLDARRRIRLALLVAVAHRQQFPRNLPQ
jgi:hypothetical protein